MDATMALTFVDLFCGAGGLALGFKEAGFRDVWAGDADSASVETYRRNVSQVAELSTIGLDTDLPACDVIIGGPPCQGFSSAGMRKHGDGRNSLVSVYAQLIASLRPRAFVFENVEGFLTGEGGGRVFDLLEPLVEAGYRIHLRKVNAANYGVPQHRKRIVAIGGYGWSPTFPRESYYAFGAPGVGNVRGPNLLPAITVADALAGLPEASTEPPGLLQGHFGSALSPADLKRAERLMPGQTMRDLPEELQHPSYVRRANRRVMDGTPTERRGGAPAGVRRLRPDEPSKAITGGARSEFLHPFEHRNLTLRECARLQTFPDWFVFVGSTAQQIQQIGNAVPPRLAHAIAATLANDLCAQPVSHEGGELLTFVPTYSSGMSPALRSLTDTVLSRFGAHLQLADLPLWL